MRDASSAGPRWEVSAGRLPPVADRLEQAGPEGELDRARPDATTARTERMRHVIVAFLLVVATVLAGCSSDSDSPDFTAPRDGDPSAPYNEIGPDPPQESSELPEGQIAENVSTRPPPEVGP